MNTSSIHPLYCKVANTYFRITDIERLWSTELVQYIYTYRGTSYGEYNGNINVDNNAVFIFAESDMSSKMKVVTRKEVMNFIGKFV